MEQLLDNKTLAAVIAAAPEIPTNRTRAIIVIAAMKRHMQMKAAQDEFEIYGYFSAFTKEIAEEIQHDNPQIDFTPHIVGYILRQFGLLGFRTRDGYQYNWTGKQFDILNNVLVNGPTALDAKNPKGGAQ